MGAIAMTVALTVNCRKAAGGDLNTAAGEYLTVIENATTAMEKAADGKEAAKIMIDVAAQTKPMEEKYPALKNLDKAPELASLAPRFTAVQTRMATVMTKYMTSPEFVEAMQKVATAEK